MLKEEGAPELTRDSNNPIDIKVTSLRDPCTEESNKMEVSLATSNGHFLERSKKILWIVRRLPYERKGIFLSNHVKMSKKSYNDKERNQWKLERVCNGDEDFWHIRTSEDKRCLGIDRNGTLCLRKWEGYISEKSFAWTFHMK